MLGMAKIFRFLIMGAPGSGKGTISSRIVKEFNLAYLSSGDTLRSQILKGTTSGKAAKKFIEKGSLVPDDVITNLIMEHLETIYNTSWLLDGFPRTVTQAENLSLKYSISLAINLAVPDDVIINRLRNRWLHPASGRIYNLEFNPPKVPGKDDVTGETLIQRNDDKPEVVLARLANYKKENDPVLNYYRKKEMLHVFVGKESNEIWPRVKVCLSEFMQKE